MARLIHFRIDEDLHEQALEAAKADRRNLSNWLVVLIERAVSEAQRGAADGTHRAMSH